MTNAANYLRSGEPQDVVDIGVCMYQWMTAGSSVASYQTIGRLPPFLSTLKR